MKRRHETPLKRVNPGGRTVWVARYTGRDGKRRSAGTFDLKREAQVAIDEAYDRDYAMKHRRDTVGAYAKEWTERRPRSERTNKSYNQRLGYVLDVPIDGLPFRDWPMHELRRSHARDMLGVLLVDQGRSAGGAQGVLRVLSAMFADALEEDIALENPFWRVRVRASDPRVSKPPRVPRIWSLEQMREFARLAGRTSTPGGGETRMWRAVYGEAMVRVFSDCGPRLGEVLALRRTDMKLGPCDEQGCDAPGPHFHVRHTAHNGIISAGTKTDHGVANAGRVCPIPPGLEALLRGLPRRIDTAVLFPTPHGKVWQQRNFYRDVWYPNWREGFNPTPHEFRHSYISLMRARGVDPADLADAVGHTVQTATAYYTHPLRQSFEAMREIAG